MPARVKKGIFYSLLTAAISGFSIFYNKMIVVKGIDPLTFNIIKNGGVAFILSILLFTFSERRKLANLSFSQWKRLILIGVIGGSIPFVLFFEGLRITPAVTANLIHKTLFIWVGVLAIPFLGERLTPWQVIGYLVIAGSNLFIGGFSGFTGNLGEIMIFLATFLWAIENIIAKIIIKNLDSRIVAWGRMFFGSLVLILIAVIQNRLILLTKLTLPQLLSTFGSILFLTGYVLTWYKALKFVPATLVTAILILATPITNILTVAFISHTLLQPQFVSILFTLLGVALATPILPLISKRKLQLSKS